MPSSFVDSFPPIVHTLIRLNPKRVLDIGPGYGKYGLACREYLPELEHLEAIDVKQGEKPTQAIIYDYVLYEDVRILLNNPAIKFNADLVLLIDVIEHMTKDAGHRLLDTIQRSGARALVSTPKVFMEQHDDHNPYERHVCLWEWQDFEEHGIEIDASTIDSIIYVLPAR